jgi:fatty acid desaturase
MQKRANKDKARAGNAWHAPCFPTGREIFSRRVRMLWTIFLVLIVLWMLGVVSSYTLGGFIHVLLVLAVIALLVQLIQGRRVV